jgi:hypothetical protein
MGGYTGWENFLPQQAKPPKRSKYRAEPTEIDGHRFASMREANRYAALKLEQQAGAISGLALQPQFSLCVTAPTGVSVTIGRYIADFRYVRNGAEIIEDAKGMRTPVYELKKKHVEVQYGIRISEV